MGAFTKPRIQVTNKNGWDQWSNKCVHTDKISKYYLRISFFIANQIARFIKGEKNVFTYVRADSASVTLQMLKVPPAHGLHFVCDNRHSWIE